MSDPRPTARQITHKFLSWSSNVLVCLGDVASGPDEDGNHNQACERLTAAIEADRAASDAREDRLREALSKSAWFKGKRLDIVENIFCGSCGALVHECDPMSELKISFSREGCAGFYAREALAAIPPRSDR